MPSTSLETARLNVNWEEADIGSDNSLLLSTSRSATNEDPVNSCGGIDAEGLVVKDAAEEAAVGRNRWNDKSVRQEISRAEKFIACRSSDVVLGGRLMNMPNAPTLRTEEVGGHRPWCHPSEAAIVI